MRTCKQMHNEGPRRNFHTFRGKAAKKTAARGARKKKNRKNKMEGI
jgi:hypothetical protein